MELCMFRQRREVRSEYHSLELLIMLFTVPSGINDTAQSLEHHKPLDYVFLQALLERHRPYTHGQAPCCWGSYLLNTKNT